jgi:hypothetical protein
MCFETKPAINPKYQVVEVAAQILGTPMAATFWQSAVVIVQGSADKAACVSPASMTAHPVRDGKQAPGTRVNESGRCGPSGILIGLTPKANMGLEAGCEW